MKESEFRAMITENLKWFDGVQNESPEAIRSIESDLSVSLPESMKWILTNYGYTFSCGVDSLTDSAETTKRCRDKLGLPNSLVILNDWGDSGVVVYDSKDERILWLGSHELESFATGSDPLDFDSYENYKAWVIARLEEVKEQEQYA